MHILIKHTESIRLCPPRIGCKLSANKNFLSVALSASHPALRNMGPMNRSIHLCLSLELLATKHPNICICMLSGSITMHPLFSVAITHCSEFLKSKPMRMDFSCFQNNPCFARINSPLHQYSSSTARSLAVDLPNGFARPKGGGGGSSALFFICVHLLHSLHWRGTHAVSVHYWQSK